MKNEENNFLEVFCAWCNIFVYKVNDSTVNNSRKSHGICDACMEEFIRKNPLENISSL